jgi:hypothetical protein
LRALFLSTLILSAFAASPATAAVRFYFEGDFSAAERDKLTTWISDVVDGVERLVGPYPFDIQLRFARTRASEPVPWANTLRGRTQGVRFHVDPRFSLDELKADWTAPHELSHLVLPFLGRSNSWFAEGFASFMQYQVMHEMGVLTAEEVTRRYEERLARAERSYNYPTRSFVSVAPRLRAERKYPTMYWGGAVFFLRASQALEQQHERTIIDVLSQYMQCCRSSRDRLDDVIGALDELLGAEFFAAELRAFRTAKGFPDYDRGQLRVIRTDPG